MLPKKNFKHYRKLHQNTDPPFVPFLAVFLTDFTFIDDSNPDFVRYKLWPLLTCSKVGDTDMINFNKVSMIAHRITNFLDCAKVFNLAVPILTPFLLVSLLQAKYPFKVDLKVQELLLSVQPFEDNDLFRISKV